MYVFVCFSHCRESSDLVSWRITTYLLGKQTVCSRTGSQWNNVRAKDNRAIMITAIEGSRDHREYNTQLNRSDSIHFKSCGLLVLCCQICLCTPTWNSPLILKHRLMPRFLNDGSKRNSRHNKNCLTKKYYILGIAMACQKHHTVLRFASLETSKSDLALFFSCQLGSTLLERVSSFSSMSLSI